MRFLPSIVICSICELSGVYGEGSFSGDVAFPYIVAINNISQFVAMYCLVLFYQANKVCHQVILRDCVHPSIDFIFAIYLQDELKPMKPFPKFLCIKAVVFFSFV